MLTLGLVLVMCSAVLARDLPAPPCVGPPTPAYPAVLDAPAIDIWLDQQDLSNWRVPACLNWSESTATVLIAVAGRFQHEGSADEMLARLGAASQYNGISYWSWSRQRWRELYAKSVALNAAETSAERPDFEADELQKGGEVFILQDESGPVGEVIQRVTIIDRSENRIEIAVTNVTPARFAFLTLFEPYGSEVRLWLERQAQDQWTYYSLTRLSGSALLAREALERSYSHRAQAMFRYLTGIEPQQGKH